MTSTVSQLRHELRHRVRPMPGRDPAEKGRTTTPLELLYDLTYVVAFGAAADLLAEHLAEGTVWPALGAYAFAVWAVSWAWLNSTWFASAYGNDDLLVRLATIVQMIGVVVLTFGLPMSFELAAHGESPNNLLLVVGYLVMRLPLIALWLRAGAQDREHRRNALSYIAIIGTAQVGWLLTTLVPGPVALTVVALVVLALAEMIAPVIAAKRYGFSPWNAGHLAERFSLLTLITIGEVVAGTTAAVGALTQEQGWTVEAVLIVASGLVIAACVWWTYFLVPSRLVLENRPERTVAWRYAHLPLFGSIAAIGAGLHLTTIAVERGGVSLLGIALALAAPLAVTIVLVFSTWSVLLRSYDLAHLPLLVLTLTPLVVAVIVGASVRPGEALDLDERGGLTSLSVVVALVALAAVIEVVGHEAVGYRHTLAALERHPLHPSVREGVDSV
ncbi:Low temperature requirement protein LtrA [Rathayibacter oskolensis]|uniref:Low temperature requirement protein LtrA n=1 Tax=Rathayibacter oskolensis TaxID=1891671 RepID=A0A1X7NVH2_9MICO|nr:low temperature requirement protein A [Rathayibacter oskolensis]SMH42257.1 Low temperature requirement protein LtrA [Rathayibacter oskolensis]